MTKRILYGAAGLAIAAAVACDRHEDTSTTQTTSAGDDFIERTRVIDEVFVPGAPNPAAGGTQPVAEPPPQKADTAPREQKRAETKPKKKTAAKIAAPMTDDTLTGDDRSDVDGAREPWDPPPVVGTATITSVYVVPMDAAEPKAVGEQPREQEQQQQQQQDYVNKSTTLGNGNSGMYTGGQGTYGGRATWGTGAGR